MTAWPAGAFPAARTDLNGECDVVLLGDSITAGTSAMSPPTQSYAALIRAALRNEFGDGGSGFSPYWSAGTGGATITGGTGDTATSTVPNGTCTNIAGAGNRYTQTAEGTEVAVWLRRATTTYGTARWRVDRGPWQTVNCSGTAGNIRASVSGLEPGSHVIDVEAVTNTVGVAGTEGRNQTGTRLHIMGMGGRTSGGNSFTGITSEANATFRSNTIGRWAPHLLVINLGVNDSTVGTVTVPAFKANMEAHIQAARAARPDCDLVLVANHLGKFTDTNYDGMKAAMVELLDTYGGLFVDLDLWARTVGEGTDATVTPRTATPNTLGDSWGRWSTYGWLADAVHPTSVGHYALGTILSQIICGPVEPVGEAEYVDFGGLA